MTMTLLATVQEFCERTGLSAPQAVIGNSDKGITQIKGLMHEVITDITGRGQVWPLLRKEGTFTTLAAESQGTILSMAPYGFKYIIQDTIYNRSQKRPLYGPRGAQAWQLSKAIVDTGPIGTWRVMAGNLYIQPTPTAGETVAFEYASDWAILATDGTTWKKRFTTDTDYFALNEDLLLLGLRWKWKKEKGLTFVTEKQDYEALLAQEMGNDSTKGELNLEGGSRTSLQPGIFVPSGSWSL